MDDRGKKNGGGILWMVFMIFSVLSLAASGIWLYLKEQSQIMRNSGEIGGGTQAVAESTYSSGTIIEIFLCSILIFAGYIFYKKIAAVKKLKKKEYDEKILKKAVAEILPDATFDRDRCIEPEMLYKKGIIPYYSTFEQPGMLSYKRQGKKYRFSNICLLRYREDKKGRGYYDTVYEGQAYAVNFQTQLQGTVRIFANRRMAVVKARTDDGYKGKSQGEIKVETENVMFNDNFNVYATDEQSAFYVLSPYVMEQMLEIKKKYNQVGVHISGERVLIALKTDGFLLKRKMYFDSRASEYLREAKGEIKKVVKMAEVLENTVNGSIKNNFTNN